MTCSDDILRSCLIIIKLLQYTEFYTVKTFRNQISTVFSVSFFAEKLGTFRLEDEDDYEYGQFSVLSMGIRFEGRHFSKCACSEQKTRTRSGPRPPI